MNKPAQPTAGIPTAVYVRISLDNEADRKGVDRQLQDCTALVKRNRWKLAAEPFVDNDVSAYNGKGRPAYKALLAKVRAGEVGRIVVYHMDRLYRQPRELEDVIELAEKGQLEVICVTGSRYDLSDSDGQLNARMIVSVAKKSSQDTARRQRDKQHKDRAAGRYTGGPRPFGWNSGPQPGTLVPHPKESAVLLAAMDKVLEGASLNDVAREWTRDKVRGRAWNGTDVTRTLTMPRHAALIVHDGAVVGDAKWKPLVDRAKWELVCAALKDRSRFAGVPRRRTMLTGIVVCGECGAKMVRSSGIRKGVRVWRCHDAPNHPGCGKVSIRADRLEPLVVEATLEHVDGVDLADLVGEDAPDLSGITKQLTGLDRREDQLGRSYAAGKVSRRLMETSSAVIEKERELLRARLSRLGKRRTLSEYAGRPGLLRAGWANLTTDQQRAIIAESLGKVTIRRAAKRGWQFDSSRIDLGQAPTRRRVR